MARSARGRTRNLSLGPLVQHKPPSPRPGRNHTATSRKQTHNNTKESGLKNSTQNPGLDKVHCLRIGCSAPTNKNKRGTGTPNHSPPHPSMRSWALLAAGWARCPRCPRRHLHSGPLRPNPTPPTPLHAKSRLTPPTAPRRNGSEPIARQAGQPAGFSETSARTRLGPSAVARMPRYWGRHAKQPMVRWSCAGVRLRHVMSMSVGVGLAVVMT